MKKLFVLFMILIAVSSCIGSKGADVVEKKGEYDSELRILKEMTQALIEHRKKTENTLDARQVTRANKDLLEKMKKLSPQIELVTKSHPEWENDPPEEVRESVLEYIEANMYFSTRTLRLMRDFVEKRQEDRELSQSFYDLKAFLTPSSSTEALP